MVLIWQILNELSPVFSAYYALSHRQVLVRSIVMPSFDETVGPKNCPPPASPPISYVYLFLTVDFITFLTSIVTHTNNYATNFLNNNRDNLRRHSISRKWTLTTVAEIKAFFAIIINMGLNRKPTLIFILVQIRLSTNSLVWTSNAQT